MSDVICTHANQPGCDDRCPHRRPHGVRPARKSDRARWDGDKPCDQRQPCDRVADHVRCEPVKEGVPDVR